jgi:uncharacterized membrane-anchored protein YjiN (DUF445 family)
MTPLPASASPIDARATALRKMQAVALALLVLAVAGLVASEWMGGQGAWAWTGAFCEAAAVGALADWFAVTALFKRPLGLPIPHTAVIPANKHRIADNLAVFVRDQFLDPATLLAKLSVFDPAERLGEWLVQPDNLQRLSGPARTLALEAVDLLDEQTVREAIHGFVVHKLRAWDAAATGGDVLDLLTTDGRHHELLDGALVKLAGYLQEPEHKRELARLMVGYARKEWPKIVKVVNVVKSVDTLADDFAERLAHALLDELAKALSSPEHVLRVRYEAWLADFMARLKADPALSERINGIKAEFIEHPAVNDYVQGLWADIREAIRRDLQSEDSALARHLAQGLRSLGQRLAHDTSLREAINTHVLSAAETLAGGLRSAVTGHIAQTVKAWDDRQLVGQIELSIGRDLQFIRINGTLVGGLIGVALHALLTLVVPMLR